MFQFKTIDKKIIDEEQTEEFEIADNKLKSSSNRKWQVSKELIGFGDDDDEYDEDGDDEYESDYQTQMEVEEKNEMKNSQVSKLNLNIPHHHQNDVGLASSRFLRNVTEQQNISSPPFNNQLAKLSFKKNQSLKSVDEIRKLII